MSNVSGLQSNTESLTENYATGTEDVKEEQVHPDTTAEFNKQNQNTENHEKLGVHDEWPSLHHTLSKNSDTVVALKGIMRIIFFFENLNINM